MKKVSLVVGWLESPCTMETELGTKCVNDGAREVMTSLIHEMEMREGVGDARGSHISHINL